MPKLRDVLKKHGALEYPYHLMILIAGVEDAEADFLKQLRSEQDDSSVRAKGAMPDQIIHELRSQVERQRKNLKGAYKRIHQLNEIIAELTAETTRTDALNHESFLNSQAIHAKYRELLAASNELRDAAYKGARELDATVTRGSNTANAIERSKAIDEAGLALHGVIKKHEEDGSELVSAYVPRGVELVFTPASLRNAASVLGMPDRPLTHRMIRSAVSELDKENN